MRELLRRSRFLLLALLVLVAVLLPGSVMAQQNKKPGGNGPKNESPTVQPHPGEEVVPDQVIVKFKGNISPTLRSATRGKEGLEKKKDLKLINAEVDKVQGQSVEQAVRDLESRPEVEYAEPDRKVYPTAGYADEPQFKQLWGLDNTGQAVNGSLVGTSDVDINAREASAVTQGDPAQVVAVIDDGVDFSHPDLKDRAWTNPGESGSGKETNGIDDDGNGKIDDVNGWDFYNNDNTLGDPGIGHGTHVSGTIAASVNGQGVVGVAPNVKIMALKFLGPDGGTISGAIDAIGYAKGKGAKISNNSWGYLGSPSQALKDAINASGQLFVAAAGNDSVNNDADPNKAAYPATYDLPNLLSVAAINDQGNLASFSNYGANSVDISAPGVDILSSVPGAKWEFWSGTSMATPHVTGTAALAVSTDPALLNDPGKLKSLLVDNGKPASATGGKTVTGKMINARTAVSAVGEATTDTVAPTGAVLINGGAASTKNPTVTLTLSTNDNEGGTGVKEMQFSNDGANWSAWEPYATSKVWPLSGGSGTRIVYAKFRDGASNVSNLAYDTIVKKKKKKRR